MKVIILGACGGMGRYVAKSISSFQEIDNLGIADLNSEDTYGAQRWDRTTDTRIFSPLLYQLSYLGLNRTLDYRQVYNHCHYV